MTKVNHRLRNAVLNIIGCNIAQCDIRKLLKKNYSIVISAPRLTVLIKELRHDGYIRLNARDHTNFWILTRKKYLGEEWDGEAVTPRHIVREHNRFYVFDVVKKTWASNMVMEERMWQPKRRRWDDVICMAGGVKQYRYFGCDELGEGITVQRMEGCRNDTIIIKVSDVEHTAREFLGNDYYFKRRVRQAQLLLEKWFSMELRYVKQYKPFYNEPHLAIRPAPLPPLQREGQKEMFKVGKLTLDASPYKGKSIPELETDDRDLTVIILKVLQDVNLMNFLLSPGFLRIAADPVELEKFKIRNGI